MILPLRRPKKYAMYARDPFVGQVIEVFNIAFIVDWADSPWWCEWETYCMGHEL